MQLRSKHARGVSLPLAVGLVLFLMLASAAVNLLVIRTLRSVHQIEASARAHGVAEAGVEDALYELSAHFAGYQTPPLGDLGVRQTDFSASGGRWENRWQIASNGLLRSGCLIEGEKVCGELRNNRKAVLSLFNDTGAGTDSILTLDLTNLKLLFRIPGATGVFGDLLVIDNDGDAWMDGEGINEDGENEDGICPGAFGGPRTGRDADCDDREDEDSPEDPVIYWKLSDNEGRSLTPLRGCIGEADPAFPSGSEICEKNFLTDGDDFVLNVDFINGDLSGVRDNGETELIKEFLARYTTDLDDMNSKQLQLELLVVAPLEQVDSVSIPPKKVPIPHVEYEVDFTTGDGTLMPDPVFVIRSDGYYQDFKQSITTTLTPRSTVPLGDFTLIQQQ